MAQYATDGETLGGLCDAILHAGVTDATDAADGTLAGAFKAQGIMTECVLEVGAIAGCHATYQRGAQQAGQAS